MDWKLDKCARRAPDSNRSAIRGADRRGGRTISRSVGFAAAALLVMFLGACHRHPPPPGPPPYAPFNYQIAVGEDRYNIVGYFAPVPGGARAPALLVLEAGEGTALRCIQRANEFTAMGIGVACINIPGYGKSSGPSRFVGPQAVEAAHHAVDLLAARSDVDPTRIAVWGISDGAVAAGLLMDSDPRLHAVVLQAGFYDTLKWWPEATLPEKLAVLRQVWPSHRVMAERSVIAHLPPKLDLNVLIMHGEHDHKMPVEQARRLAKALSARGAHVETRIFADGGHDLGSEIDAPLREFLHASLLAAAPAASATP